MSMRSYLPNIKMDSSGDACYYWINEKLYNKWQKSCVQSLV